MKKFISVLCMVSILIASLSSVVSANPQDDYDLDTPVIMIAPFTDSSLEVHYDNGEIEPCSVSIGELYNLISIDESSVKPAVFAFMKGLLTGNYKSLVDIFAQECQDLEHRLELLEMKPDGTSANNIVLSDPTTPQGAQGISTYPSGYFYELENLGMNPDNIFAFCNDYRLGQIELAKRLDAFIQDVKAFTGKETVSLCGYSGGGQIAATYLAYYAGKGDVSRVILHNSPTAGTKLASAVFDSDSFNLNTDYVLEQFLTGQDTLLSFLRGFNLDFLNKGFYQVVTNIISSHILYWGGWWDMVPVDDYDRLKAVLLDPVENGALIAASDEYHNNVAANMSEILQNARSMGIAVSLISITGTDIIFCEGENGDGIVDVANSTGATVLSGVKHFKSGYSQLNTVCKEEGHYHLSGSFNIDASTAFLPDNTWFVSDGFHDDVYNSLELAALLTISDKIENVYSDKNYPQFIRRIKWTDTIRVSTDVSGDRYLTADNTQITIENLSEDTITLTSVFLSGSGLHASVPYGTKLKPGEDITLDLKGTITKNARQYITVKIIYYIGSEIIPQTCKLGFTANPAL